MHLDGFSLGHEARGKEVKEIRILDLFCGAGGAAVGMAQACRDRGFEPNIVGVDRYPQKEYPFAFLLSDVLDIFPQTLREFDFIWASPPCQAFSIATNDKRKHKNYIPRVRELLQKGGKPWVIENVPLAPLKPDLLLCGEMFGLRVIRHRIFEVSGFYPRMREHLPHKGLSRRLPGGAYRKNYYYESVAGQGCSKNIVQEWQAAMGISHITKRKGLAQAVPPAYAKYIFGEFLNV